MILNKLGNMNINFFNPFFMFIFGLLIHFALPNDKHLLHVIRLFIGVLVFLYIPGYFLVTCFLRIKSFKNFGFYLIFGFLYQLLNIFVIWLSRNYFKHINFSFLIYFLTSLFILTLILYIFKVRDLTLFKKSLWYNFFEIDPVLLKILAIFLTISFYYRKFCPSIHSDGAAYLDFARNVVQNGVFSSSMIFPTQNWDNVAYGVGFHSYIFSLFSISFFFFLGNISLLSAQILLLFCCSLSIFLVYYICNELLDREVARIATFLLSISPIYLTHISLVGGPEIISLLFGLLFIYLFIISLKIANRLLLSFLAGISLFITWYSWTLNFVILFLGVMPFLYFYFLIKHKELNFRNILFYIVLVVSFLVEYRFSLNLTLILTGFSFPTAILIAAVIGKKLIKNITVKFLLIVILTNYTLLFIRHISAVIIMPLIKQVFIESNVYFANLEVTFGFFNRIIDLNTIIQYSLIYWNGLSSTLTQVILFLGIASFMKLKKIKETLLLCSFPFFHWLIWSLIVTVDFQPRYIISASVFWIMLAASSINLLIPTEASFKPTKNYKIVMIIGKTKRSINLNSVIRLSLFIFIFINIMLFWYPIYNNLRINVLEDWNYSSRFGWDPAIQWIKENTQPEDILMARRGNYWAWFTERKTVFFARPYFGSVNITQLTSLIKEFKVKYLIVDYNFYSEFPELSILYSSSTSSYEFQKVFYSVTKQGYKVIIYNVTDISYGNFIR